MLLDNLKAMGLETEIINAYDYEITPCSRCNYECFNAPKTCPIQDDVPKIWRKLKQADAAILAVPVYYGMPPALFQAIIERGQGILDWVTPELRDLNGVWGGKAVAVLIVSDGEGQNVKNMIQAYFPPRTKVIAEVFHYGRYGSAKDVGDLNQNRQITSSLKWLATELTRMIKKAKNHD
jgi:multimeric flavodoxin WrbA